MMEIETNNNIHVEKFLERKEKNNEKIMVMKSIYFIASQCEFARLINLLYHTIPNVKYTFFNFF
jgi:hypothetical protein